MSNLSTVKSRIYQAVVDIHSAGRIATRAAVASRTGYKFSVVDDHIKSLKDDGKVRSVVNGVFEPAEVFAENRPVSKTALAGGLIKVEVGDQCLELTPGEAAEVGLALYGNAMTSAHIMGERSVYDLAQSLRGRLHAAEKSLSDMAKLLAQRTKEPDLFTEG